MKRNLLFILFSVTALWLCCAWAARAGEKDSLEQVIKKSFGDEKLKTQALYANAIAEESPDSAANLAQFVLDRCRKDQPYVMGMSYLALGESEYYKQNFKLALRGYNNAIPYFSSIDDNLSLAYAYNSIGIIHRFRCDFDSAMIAFRQSLVLEQKSNHVIGMAKCYQNIGLVLLQVGERNGFYTYTGKALAIYEKLNLRNRMAETANNLAVSYIEEGKFDKAETYYLKALAGFRSLQDQGNEGNVLINLSSLYFKQKKRGDALVTINKAIDLFSEIEDYVGLVHSHSIRGDLYYDMGDTQQAISEYLVCEQLNQHIHIRDVQINNLQSLAEAYKRMGDFEKALTMTEKGQIIRDSVYDTQRMTSVMDLERLYKDELSKNDQLLSRISQQQLMLGLIGTCILIILIIGYVVFRYYHHRQRENQRLVALDQSVLRANMTPHLLFNSLTSIQYFILENKQTTAIEYLGEYSKLMRLMLKYSQEEYITLAHEKEVLELYLSLQSLRLNHRLKYIIHSDESLDPAITLIPPMLGHPFLEQIIERGFPGNETEGTLWISFSRVNNLMVYRIQDNGLGQTMMNTDHLDFSQWNVYSETMQRILLINQGIDHANHIMFNLVDLSSRGKDGLLFEFTIPINELASDRMAVKDLLLHEKAVIA
jgi:tetratricopeptide (TPR) repeat protein